MLFIHAISTFNFFKFRSFLYVADVSKLGPPVHAVNPDDPDSIRKAVDQVTLLLFEYCNGYCTDNL